MIASGLIYFSVLVCIAATLALIARTSNARFFEYCPPIVLLYFSVMILGSAGLWDAAAPEVVATYTSTKDVLLPAMIFLMLLKSDFRRIRKLGRKLLIGFFTATVSIGLGFVITFVLFQQLLEPDAWKTFAVLTGSWMGGTGNMVAIQGALDVADSNMGYALIVDSIDYAIWVVILLALVPFAQRFGRWTNADTGTIDAISQQLENGSSAGVKSTDTVDLLVLFGSSILVSAVVQSVAAQLPATDFFTQTTWTVLLVTVLGAAAAMTRFARVAGSAELATAMLFIVVALIASRANLAELGQAPLYILAGFVVLLIHAALMAIAAKAFRLDLFTCGIASLANIGGIASAPILAAAYSRALIPIGVLMAMLGYIVGTAGGLIVGRMLFAISQ